MAKTTEQDIKALAELKENLGRDSKMEELMEKFNQEFPNGDSLELATFMYQYGYDEGFQAGKEYAY